MIRTVGRESAPASLDVFLVDDHEMVRKGLAQLIGQESDLVVCGEAPNAREALQALGSVRPDVAVIDIALEKDLGGLELIRIIRSRYPDMAILALSMHDESMFAERALRAGAQGYIMKTEAVDTLLSGIRRVAAGEICLSDRIAETILRGALGKGRKQGGDPIDLLTDRELEVFQLIGRGIGTSRIAARLFLSVKTIETYRARIKEKLSLPSGAALNTYAIRWVQSNTLA